MLKTIVLVALIFATTVAFAEDAEHSAITSNSAVFVSGASEALQKLRAAHFDEALQAPGLGSVSPVSLEELVHRIRAATPISGVETGKAGILYDVIVQPGHYGRRSGALGTSGARVSEKELAAYLAAG